ncbi:plastoglobulin-1, chloroplastic [Quercus suber]|uniref:Plastid lipid-associated protein 3 n=1 Tax=Quercus suber TaxID=58331 RepID=A0AAW0LF02_QUESU|nr:plastoglobulin-1, chloroplastic [Quercus suber]POE52948.1 plastid lipid-associated protein 3, chloroplastic [Quercus suber]
MSLLFITTSSLFTKITPNPNIHRNNNKNNKPSPLPLLSFTKPKSKTHFLQVTHSSLSDSDPTPKPRVSDEWGEPSEPEPEPESPPDPPKNEDEWGPDDATPNPNASSSSPSVPEVKEEEEDKYATIGDGNNAASTAKPDVSPEENKLAELKRCLVDTFYGTEFGFRASPEVRAEVSELVNQLEASNPTPAPTQSTDLLQGNWVLLYTAFSELLPLLALGATPLLKVKEIRQVIDTGNLTIVNSTTLSGPFATLSFSATATFEVQSPTRIKVAFKEGTFQPPEIKTSIDLPENVDVFGQQINLLPVQQTLNPLQDAVASISRVISGQPPLKVPIPGDRTSSWLLVTYLDDDLRISRGDGGLFVLAKEGSPLLD